MIPSPPHRPLAADPDVAAIIGFKAALIWEIRQFLHGLDAWEVPMPVLHRTREGAPLDQWSATEPGTGAVWHLRHCMEDHLRRVSAAHPRVFEIGKAVRADGGGPMHGHEFVVLELVFRRFGYGDGVDLLTTLMRDVIAPVAERAYGRGAMFGQVRVRPWDDVCVEATGLDPADGDFLAGAESWLKDHDLIPDRPYTQGWEVLEDLMRYAIEPACTEATIITNFPRGLQHVCDTSPDLDGRAMRVSAVVNGVEISDGGVKFSDSAAYRRIYAANAAYRRDVLGLDRNDLPEAFFADLDAIGEPAFTSGVGIDRIAALVAGCHIHQAMIFPEG